MKTCASRIRGWAVLGLVLAALGACSTQAILPSNGVRDLYAIHDSTDWAPHSPASLSHSPTAYSTGYPVDGIFVSGTSTPEYDIENHQKLEMDILDRIADTYPLDTASAVEAVGVLTVELTEDHYLEARRKSAEILSAIAGAWVDRAGVRLQEAAPSSALPAALERFNALMDDPARTPESVAAAVEELARIEQDDPLTAARVLTGVSRRLHEADYQVTGERALQEIGLRTVLVALAWGADSAEPELAEPCLDMRRTILEYAVEG